MVKLTGPLLSQDAHGQLAKQLIYSHKKTGQQVRPFHWPKKEVSLKQWTQRHIIGLLTADWQCKTAVQKLVFENLAKERNLKMSGFNYFVQLAISDLKTYHGLCGYWSMNEASGAQVVDYSGQGNHGTLKPSYPSNCPFRVDAMSNEYGLALKFDGTNDGITVPNSGNLQLIGSATFCWWMKINDLTVNRDIIDKGYLTEFYIFRWGGGNRIELYQGNGAAYDVMVSSSGIVSTNWEMWCIVRNNTAKTASFYRNGVLDVTRTYTKTIATSINNVGIGKRTIGTGTSPFNGSIDEVRVYSRALSATEILKQYHLLRLDKRRQKQWWV